jgi:hypothetical protein
MGRRFITARDVDDVVAAGRRELRLEAGDRLTDLARERARDRDVTVVEAGASSSGASGAAPSGGPGPASTPGPAPAGPAVPTPAPSGMPARASASDGTAARPQAEGGPPRRQLRAAVRAGVVEEFGGAPEGLDAAIGRVFDRLGIRAD